MIKDDQTTVKPLYDAVCMLAKDIESIEVTAGNKELVRNSLMERISSLPWVPPHSIQDLQPDQDATLKLEIQEITARVAELKQQLAQSVNR